LVFLFFFSSRRRHTRSKRDWSSDVCSSDLSACDVVAWNPDYLGPAALNRAWTLVKDERDAATIERLRAVAGDAGCHACHTHMSRSEERRVGKECRARTSTSQCTKDYTNRGT